MHHQFNTHKFYVLTKQCTNVFCVDSKPSQSSNWGGDLREARVDVTLSVSHSCL